MPRIPAAITGKLSNAGLAVPNSLYLSLYPLSRNVLYALLCTNLQQLYASVLPEASLNCAYCCNAVSLARLGHRNLYLTIDVSARQGMQNKWDFTISV